MSCYIGLDTSNYTTSAAAFDAATGALWQVKQLLPVEEGKMGLRQSDAVFHHTKQLPVLLEQLFPTLSSSVEAVGVSTRPMEEDGSYMPCFLAGTGTARSLAAAFGKPLYRFTHQQGHVMAVLYGAGKVALRKKPLLAFHVSGGTTEALLVRPSEETVITCSCVARSRDLKAGQLIDRVGGMLGMPFPAGPMLDNLSQRSVGDMRLPRPTVSGADCHLSGVENQCRRMLEQGAPREDVARFCLLSIQAALTHMTEQLLLQYGDLPVVYAGGVMSNTLLQKALGERFGGVFAPAEYSADNAVGIAVLTTLRAGGTLS